MQRTPSWPGPSKPSSGSPPRAQTPSRAKPAPSHAAKSSPASPVRKLTAQQYIAAHHIDVYLRDVVHLLLQSRNDRPLKFIADYFGKVLDGTHVLLREFAYVYSCPRNRWDFFKAFVEVVSDFETKEPLTPTDLTRLLQLLCPDFPLSLVENAAALCGGSTHQPLPFTHLLHATCVCFYYAEFLERTAEVRRRSPSPDCPAMPS